MIIGLDLGTTTGFAVLQDGEVLASGSWPLSRPGERWGMTWGRLELRLSKLREKFGAHVLDAVFFELVVAGHKGTAAAHCYGAARGAMSVWCERQRVEYFGLAVGAIKKFATGNGRASKDLMEQAARENWPNIDIVDDNHADALWVASLGEERI